jgi:hypothetical protein
VIPCLAFSIWLAVAQISPVRRISNEIKNRVLQLSNRPTQSGIARPFVILQLNAYPLYRQCKLGSVRMVDAYVWWSGI